MNLRTALLDANVLYSASIRDLLMQLAVAGLYRARWTADISAEWSRSLLQNNPGLERAAVERTRAMMDTAIPDCLVTGHERIVHSLNLPDPHDRHVLAAAIAGRCDVIVTQNLKDFPASQLAPSGIEALSPDDFLCSLLIATPRAFCIAANMVRNRLKNPPYSAAAYLANLARQGLVETASKLGAHADQI